MTTATKSLKDRHEHGKLRAELGQVSRAIIGFTVLDGDTSYTVAKVAGVVCTCEEFRRESQEDLLYRCEHILAVKYYLEMPTDQTVR